YRDRDLKKIGRGSLNEAIISSSTEGIAKIDLSELAQLLDPEYGVKTACNWLRDRFGVEMTPEEVEGLSKSAFIELAQQRARNSYDDRESEYPVLAGLYRFATRNQSGQRQGLQREELVESAKRRFGIDLSL